MLNYVNRVQVGLAAGTDSNNDTLASLGRGDMLVLDSNMTPITTAPSDNLGPRQSFYVALGTGVANAPFILSSPIFGDSVKSYLGKPTRAAADQVSKVNIVVPAADDQVKIVIALKDRQRIIANRQTRIVMASTADSANVYDLASALAGQSQFSSPYQDPYGVRVDVTDVAGTVTVADNLAAVNKGSKIATFATAAEHNTGTEIAVGDILAFDDISYGVTAVNALAISLDRAFQGASGNVAAVNIDVIKTPTAASLTVTGVDSPFNNNDIDIYEKPSFEIGSDQDGAIVTNVTAVDLGQGIYEQVKAMEFAVQHNLGNSNLVQWPIPVFDFHAVEGIAYNVIQIASSDKHEGDLQGQMESPVGLTIAFSSSSNAQADNITVIIDALIPKATALGTW